MKIATSLAGRVLASTERHVSTQKSITRTAYGFASPVWDHDSLNDRKEPQQNLSANVFDLKHGFQYCMI